MKKIFAVICSLTAGAVMAAEAKVLLKNANFEKMAGKNLADWICVVPANGLAVSGETGKKVLKLTHSGSGACMVVQRNLPLAYNKSYAVSCEVKSADQGSGMVYVEYRVKQADGKFKHISVNAKAIHGSEKWTETLFEVGPRAKECEAPYIVLVSSSNSMEFRNLKIEELD